MIKKLFLTVILVFALAIPGWATTYYVTEDGAGDNDGSSYANAESLSDFNGGSFGELDDDTVYFCDTIRGTVTIPDGGTSGHVATFRGDYTGHAGTIKGSDLVTTWIRLDTLPVTSNLALWLDGEFSTITDSGGAISQWDDISGNDNHATQGTADNKPTKKTSGSFTVLDFDNGDWLNLTDTIGSGNYDVWSIFAVVQPDNTAEADTIIAGGANSLGFRVDADEKIDLSKTQAAWINTTPTALATDDLQVVAVTYDETNYKHWLDQSIDESGSNNPADITAGLTDIGARGDHGEQFSGDIACIIVYTAELSEADAQKVVNYLHDRYNNGVPSNTSIYYASHSTDSGVICFDGTLGTEETTASNVDTDQEWYWSSDTNTLYQHSTSDPDTRYTSPGTEASVRNNCIVINAKDYITIDSLTVYHANQDGIVPSNDVDNLIIDNCNVSYNYERGLDGAASGADSLDDWTIEDSTFSYNGAGGLTLTINWDNPTIQRNTVNNNAWNFGASPFDFTFGIKVWSGGAGTGTNATIQYNKVYSNGKSGSGANSGNGIWVDEADGGNVVKYNLVYSNIAHGIQVELTDSVDVFGNIVHDHNNTNFTGGIYFYKTNSSKAYNNTVQGGDIGMMIQSDDDAGATTVNNNLIKNNIFTGNDRRELYAVQGGENDGTNGTGNVYTYNCFGAEATSFIEWGSGVFKSTYDAWETAYGSGTSSAEADPLFTNEAGDDFTLQELSPCIDSGTNLGSIYDDGWPTNDSDPSDGLTTLDQDNWGGGWEIGAYIYEGTSISKKPFYRAINFAGIF